MTKQEFLNQFHLTEDQFYGRELITHSFYLDHLTSLPDGFSPYIASPLVLNKLEYIPYGFNPIVINGCGLYLNSIKKIPFEFNPQVEGNVYLPSLEYWPPWFTPKIGGTLNLRDLKAKRLAALLKYPMSRKLAYNLLKNLIFK